MFIRGLHIYIRRYTTEEVKQYTIGVLQELYSNLDFATLTWLATSLPVAGEYRSVFYWSSSNQDIFNPNGYSPIFNHPEEDTLIEIYLDIHVDGNYSETLIFEYLARAE